MDDEAALLARRVALAASAWLNAPTDVQAYTRLVDAVDRWNSYCTPPMRLPTSVDSEAELLDALGEDSEPRRVGESLAALEMALRTAARKAL